MTDPNTPDGPSSGTPRDPSDPAAGDFQYSSDATQLWGPEEEMPAQGEPQPAADPAPLPDEAPSTPAEAPAAADATASADEAATAAADPTPPQPPLTPAEAAFAAGETAPWPTVDAPQAADPGWDIPAAGAGDADAAIAGAGSPDAAGVAAGAAAGAGGPEPWEAPQTPGALHSATLARGVSAGKPQPGSDPGSTGKPVAIVAGVIGAAVVVAAGAWFLLFNPNRDNTASASPTPTAIVTPGPTGTLEPTEEPTLEPTEEPTPEPTAFRAPRFTGRTVEEAEALAAAGGLQLRKEFDDTSTEPDGVVLAQDPPPGAAVRPGDTVILTIARTGPTVLVPDVVGETEADALNLLLDADLEPGERTEAFDALIPAGAIVSTDPAADEEVERQSTVAYVVSGGPEPTPTTEPTLAPIAVPDLRGTPEEDAVNELLDLGLEPGDRTEAFDDEVAAGDVISTDPEAGTDVPVGTSVAYVVSLGAEPTPSPEPTPAPVEVPDLRGVGEDDAVNQLLDLGLEPGGRTESFDEDVPAGAVIGTDPEAGTEVVVGTTVAYVVSLGVEPTPTPEPTPAPVAIPDLRGTPEEDAVNQLLDLGLEPGERTEAFDDDIAAGAILSTDPEAGTDVPPGTSVSYLVSQGPEPTPTPEPTPAPVAIPDLRGTPEEDAVNQLLDLGLEPGERTEAFDEDVPEGAVIGTDPAAGVEVAVGTSVSYVVSLGVEPTPTPEPTPAPVAIPDLRGVGEGDAVNQLLDLGLEPGERTEAFSEDISAGSVLSTDPGAGTEVPPGTTVSYVVSQGPEPTPTPEPTPAPVAIPDLRGVGEDDAVNQLLDLGLEPGERTEAFSENVAQGAVISTEPEAGAEVPPGTSIAYVVSQGPEPTPTPEPTPAPVAIPDLRGVGEDDAVNQLLDLGLEPGERTESFDDAVAAGAVISTDPAAGSEVTVGTSIAYVVSQGPEPTPTPEPTPAPVAIPDLRGTPEEDAVSQLLDLGLEPGERTDAFSEDIAAGSVLSTDPGAGTEVTVGTSIAYVVSQGPEPTPTPEPTPAPVAIPDLRGIPEEDAVNQLLDFGLEPGERTERFHDNVAQDAVIRTDPEAGTEVPPGTSVSYVVSLGVEPTPTPEPTPAPVAIPDLRGVGEDDAVNQLLDLGLEPGGRTERFHENVPQGAVIRTDPEAGTEVPPGTSVSYVVSQGPEPTPTPEPTPAPVVIPDLRGVGEEDAVNQLLDLGLEPGERSESFDGEVPAGAVTSTDPAAGTEVSVGTSVSYVVSLGAEPTPTPEPTPALVAIPDLRGVAEEDAVNQLLDLGLEPGERTERFNENVPQGAVIRTDPPAGTEVDAGSTVAYVVSRGPEATPAPIVVPDLRGVAEEDAVNQLIEAGLQPGTRRGRFHESVPEGAFLRTDPPSGTEVPPGAVVDYFVSRGPEPTPEATQALVEVPNLRGSSPEDAVNALLDAGLTPGERRNRFNDNVARGEVIRTDPQAGEQVPAGTTVDYFVSRGPEAVDEPTPAPTERPDPTQTSSDPQAAIDAIAEQVQGIRELDARENVPYREISRRAFRQEIEAQFDEENPPRRIAAEERFLKRMGLIPRDMDLRETLLDLYESQVAAFYDPQTGAMTVIGNQDDFGVDDRLFTSHEYQHALQDQHWDLEAVTDVSPSQGDRALARLALIEGDATAVMFDWAMQNLSPDDIAALSDAVSTMDQELLERMPPIIRRQLEAPYLDGLTFVTALRRSGGWEAVDAAFEQLPASTEQILHPERYPDDRPARVELPDVAAALGDGWTTRYNQTLGELGARILLADGGSESDMASAADGWGGDRLTMVEGPDDAWAIVWQTAWDTEDDAQQFAESAALGSAAGVHTVLPGMDVTGGQNAPVLVLVASDDATLAAVEEALGVAEVVLQ